MSKKIFRPIQFLGFLALFGFSALASGIEPDALVGEGYASARRSLMENGWRGDTNTKVMDTERQIKRRYPELDACASDKPFCSFTFHKRGKCIRVITEGEGVKTFVVKSIAYDC